MQNLYKMYFQWTDRYGNFSNKKGDISWNVPLTNHLFQEIDETNFHCSVSLNDPLKACYKHSSD